MDDRRLGLVLRALRRRLGLRQSDLARAARVSPSTVSRIERGHLGRVSVATVRKLFAAVDARFEGEVRWRGGELDHLLDRLHAELGAAVATELQAEGWSVMPEITFMRFGERGSIDMLAVRQDWRIALLVELKTEMTSFEQTQRRLDAKRRVFASVVEERCGWRPVYVGVILVLADTTTNRARVRRVEPLFATALPARTWAIRRWLGDPAGDMAGIWFFRNLPPRTGKRRAGGPHRVRRPANRRNAGG